MISLSTYSKDLTAIIIIMCCRVKGILIGYNIKVIIICNNNIISNASCYPI